MPRIMYATLDAGRITATVRDISQRLSEEFPGSGLSQVSVSLCDLAEVSAARARRLARPDWRIRIPVGLAVAALIGVAGFALTRLPRIDLASSMSDLAQGLEAGVSDIIFLGVALFFLFSLEARSKRRQALASLNDLRSIAHVIDMHQLTKDPEIARHAGEARTMSQIEIARYLDYCSELLAVTSKLAALHLQAFSDPVVLDSVNGIQALTLGLSGKIWQKIMILDMVASAARR